MVSVVCIIQSCELSVLLCCRLHEQLNESDDAAQCYMLYIQDIFSCGVSTRPPLFMTNLQLVHRSGNA